MDFGALQRGNDYANAGMGGGGLSSSNSINIPYTSVYDHYTMLEELGHGAYGTVMKAKRKKASGERAGYGSSSSGHKHEFYAVKHIDKRKAGQKGLREVHGEVETMTLLTHPNIVHLEETFQDDNNLWIVMEYVAGGELHKALKRQGSISEASVRRIAMNLLFAVDYIHQKGIVHRDLKPANCLLNEEGEFSLKIADFGFAVMVGSDSCLTSFCGTTAYMAPEIILDLSYGKPVDMWATGVIVYLLLSGDYPFIASPGLELTDTICEGQYSFSGSGKFGDISPGARDFISRCLVVDPSRRITAREALKHPWVKSAISMDPKLSSSDGAEGDASAGKRQRPGKLLFRGGVLAVMAAHRLLFLTRCMALRREGADFPLLMSFTFLVGRRFAAPQNQLVCPGTFTAYPRAVLHLTPMVEACTTLEVLDLSSNNIDSLDATQAIVRAVTNHPSLQVLILDGNPIPQLAGRALLRLARTPGKLRTISVQHTPVTADVVQQIGTSLKEAERKREAMPPMSPSTTSTRGHHGYGAAPPSSVRGATGSLSTSGGSVGSPSSSISAFASGLSSRGGGGAGSVGGGGYGGGYGGRHNVEGSSGMSSHHSHGHHSRHSTTPSSSSSTRETRLPPIPSAAGGGSSSIPGYRRAR